MSTHKPRPMAPEAAPVAHRPVDRDAPFLWGRHAVVEALGNPARKILRLVATEDMASAIAEARADVASRLEILTREEIARLLPPGAVHQGVALMTRQLATPDLEDAIDAAATRENAVFVLLDQVTDPHNIGAVLRSAAAFGALAVIMPDRHAPEISGTLAKSASGAVEHVPLIRAVNLVRALERLKAAGFWTVGLDGAADSTLAALKLSGRICLVLGAEGDGLRRLTRESCDHLARLPTSGPIASLNVSNAAAIALYELARG